MELTDKMAAEIADELVNALGHGLQEFMASPEGQELQREAEKAFLARGDMLQDLVNKVKAEFTFDNVADFMAFAVQKMGRQEVIVMLGRAIWELAKRELDAEK
jgi:hypothetical protein